MTPLGREWTAAEDDVLRARYLTEGARAMATALGRSVGSVNHHTQRLGLFTHRRWSAADDRKLALIWGDSDTASTAAEMGRTVLATVQRAKERGLPLGVPHGMEGLTNAAIRTGFGTSSLRMILRWARVRVRHTMSRPTGGAPRTWFVDPDEVDEAVEAWLKTETLNAAAQRHGITSSTLERWLLLSGAEVPPKPSRKRRWRVPTETVDAVVAKRRSALTIRGAAKILGIPRGTLRHRAVRAGIPRTPGKLWLVELAAVAPLARAA